MLALTKCLVWKIPQNHQNKIFLVIQHFLKNPLLLLFAKELGPGCFHTLIFNTGAIGSVYYSNGRHRGMRRESSKSFPWPGSRLKHETQYRLFGFLGPFRVTNLPQSLGNWLLKSMKDHIEQTKDPSHKSHHNLCEMLYFWHTLLDCFNTLSLSVKVQYSNWMLLAVRCWSWKWSQFLLARQCVTFCEHGQLKGWQPHFQPNVA